MPELTPTPGPHITRRITEPPSDYLQPAARTLHTA